MVVDDIIVGSGLAALAVAWGLPAGRRVRVIAGLAQPAIERYDNGSGIPCANTGTGGLGAYWHGVIPMRSPFELNDADTRAGHELFGWLYPRTSLDGRWGHTRLFVPLRPIRPAREWPRLRASRPALDYHTGLATMISRDGGQWRVRTTAGDWSCARVWLAAGALGTPALLSASSLSTAVIARASDHVIIYLGQIDRRRHAEWAPPRVERAGDGVWMDYRAEPDGQGVVTCKPARFDYRRLDHGIEQRAAFGLPTAGVIGKLMRAGSPGLISESLFNKFGLFPRASLLSVYAQLRVHEAWERVPGQAGLSAVPGRITARVAEFRRAMTWPELTPSRRPELFVRGIHLHRTVESARLPGDGLAVVDASILGEIGPEHHSFGVMAMAAARARESA